MDNPVILSLRKFPLIVVLFALYLCQPVLGQDVDLGKDLFENKCKSCHYLGPHEKKLIGPGLNEEIFEEYTTEWLYKWIRNSTELIKSGDKQAIAVYEEYNEVLMTAFPTFSDADIDNILAYIKEGPQEEVVVENTSETKEESNNNLWYFVLAILVLNIILLIYVKNTLKVAAGIQKVGFFDSAYLWLNKNPAFIAFCVLIVVFIGLKMGWNTLSTIGVNQNYQPEQPIAFSHKIHAGDQGIDCNYCHHTARDSKHAGIPSLNVCMNCHTYITEGSISGKDEIKKIYAALGFDPQEGTYQPDSLITKKPVEWVRIHNLPDLAYFNHSQHVNVAGIECKDCHGSIEKMDEVYQDSKLTMGWCINCHRETEVDTDNPYYHDLHKNWIKKYHTEKVTVDMIGGLECAKCHY